VNELALFAGAGGGILGGRCLDGERYAPWKSTLSAADDSCSAKMKDTFHRSPFGMMFVPSTDVIGAELLTSFLEASRAKTSARLVKARESTGSVLGCGGNLLASLARFDRDSRSWRTHQTSLVAGLDVFSETWPRWGSMRNGVCWARTALELHTSATGFGSLLPTLTASHYGSNQGGEAGRVGPVRLSLQTMASRGLLPTLTRCGNYNRKVASPTSGDGLVTALAKLPTLRRTDGERGGRGDLIQALRGNPNSHYKIPTLTKQDAHNNGSPSQRNRNTPPLNAEVGGPLNPDWCEWFMGWPIGWTASAPLGTDRFRQWLRLHGRC